jgi:hypothetical protein
MLTPTSPRLTAWKSLHFCCEFVQKSPYILTTHAETARPAVDASFWHFPARLKYVSLHFSIVIRGLISALSLLFRWYRVRRTRAPTNDRKIN